MANKESNLKDSHKYLLSRKILMQEIVFSILFLHFDNRIFKNYICNNSRPMIVTKV